MLFILVFSVCLQLLCALSKSKDAIADKFAEVYLTHAWGEEGNGSGPGSSERSTAPIAKYLVSMIPKLNIRSFLDAPCGGMLWMPKVLHHLENRGYKFHYEGMDVVKHVIDAHKISFLNESRWTFTLGDITTTSFGRSYDLILSRDVMFHLSERNIKCAINNFILSNSTYFLSTSYPGYVNSEVVTWTPAHILSRGEVGKLDDGSFRSIDLASSPYNLGSPVEKIDEVDNRIVGLWKLSSLSLYRDATGVPLSCLVTTKADSL